MTTEEVENTSDVNTIDSDEETEYESLYFKYWFDGCKTIDEVLCGVEALKIQFEEWKKEGYQLRQPVDTGYCFIDKVIN
jgi:hypothetical protein